MGEATPSDEDKVAETDDDLQEALGIGAGLAIGGAAIGAGNLLGNLFDDLDDEEEEKEPLTEDDVEEGLLGDINLSLDASGQSVGILNGQGGQVTNKANEGLLGDINVNLDASGQSVGLLGGTGDTVTNEGKKTSIDRSKFKRRIRESVEENPLKNIRSNVIEFPNGEYVYIEYKGGKLVAGSATNNGIIPEYEIDYDNSVSADVNIQNLYDVITEKNPDLLNEAIKNPDATRNKVIDRLNKSSDKDLVRDLTLCIENDGEVYRRFTTPVIENLKKKYKKGNFDKQLAIQAFYNVVVNALKMPHFYRDYSYSIKSVGVPERYAVAENLLSGAMDEITYDSRMNEAADATKPTTAKLIKDFAVWSIEDAMDEFGVESDSKDLDRMATDYWKDMFKVKRLYDGTYYYYGIPSGTSVRGKLLSNGDLEVSNGAGFTIDSEYISTKSSKNEAVDVTDRVTINTKEAGFITKKKDLEGQGYKVIGSGDGQIIMAKPKAIKEGLSYGELTAIESEWNKFKKSKGIDGKAEADVAWEFIDTECKGVYDTEDERNDVFGVISTLEEKCDGGNCEEKPLNEAPYLEPRYDARQSFYNKAFVTDDDNDLYSYGLKVMTIKDGQPVITCPVDRISQTTLRHIKEFLLQNGFKAINKAQILRDYKQEVPTRDIKIDECNKPMNEDVRDSHYRDYIYDYFEFSTDDKFLDLIADLLDRVEDFSNEQEVWEAVDSGMIYTQDQWTAYMHYCDMGDPAENMWEGLMGDMLAICSKIADNAEEDDDDETMDESLKESYMRKWKQRFTEGINNATVETDDSKLTMSADENGKVTVTTEPIDSTPVDGEAVAPLDDGEIDAIIDASAEEVDEPIEDELGDEEIDFDIEEVDEESLDDLGESYMKRIYENVDSFKTSKVHTDTDKMIVEGVIKFKSGKTKKTGFIFEAHNATKDGKVKFLGENKHFSNRRGAFTLNGVVKGKKLIAESLTYNYQMGKKDTVKGSVKRSK